MKSYLKKFLSASALAILTASSGFSTSIQDQFNELRNNVRSVEQYVTEIESLRASLLANGGSDAGERLLQKSLTIYDLQDKLCKASSLLDRERTALDDLLATSSLRKKQNSEELEDFVFADQAALDALNDKKSQVDRITQEIQDLEGSKESINGKGNAQVAKINKRNAPIQVNIDTKRQEIIDLDFKQDDLDRLTQARQAALNTFNDASKEYERISSSLRNIEDASRQVLADLNRSFDDSTDIKADEQVVIDAVRSGRPLDEVRFHDGETFKKKQEKIELARIAAPHDAVNNIEVAIEDVSNKVKKLEADKALYKADYTNFEKFFNLFFPEFVKFSSTITGTSLTNVQALLDSNEMFNEVNQSNHQEAVKLFIQALGKDCKTGLSDESIDPKGLGTVSLGDPVSNFFGEILPRKIEVSKLEISKDKDSGNTVVTFYNPYAATTSHAFFGGIAKRLDNRGILLSVSADNTVTTTIPAGVSVSPDDLLEAFGVRQ